MKIMILGSGRSYHATRWADSLANEGIDVIFVTQHKVERPLGAGIKVVQLPFSSKLGYVLNSMAVKRIITKELPDIVHAHYASGYGGLASLSVTGQLRRRFIISVYGSDIFDFPHISVLHKIILNRILKSAHVILSTSETMADEIVKLFPNFERPTVTPFGVDVNAFCPLSCGAPSSAVFRVGIVKKLEQKYGLDVLLYAIKWFVENVTENISLSIVGEGSEKEKLVGLAVALGLEKRVKFIGGIPNSKVPSVLQSLDVFVVPSRYESFGVAAVEAMACGIPVIVSNVGGLPEVVQHQVSGMIFQNEDYVELGELLSEMFSSTELRARLAINARKRVKELYNWNLNLKQMINIYEQSKGS